MLVSGADHSEAGGATSNQWPRLPLRYPIKSGLGTLQFSPRLWKDCERVGEEERGTAGADPAGSIFS